MLMSRVKGCDGSARLKVVSCNAQLKEEMVYPTES